MQKHQKRVLFTNLSMLVACVQYINMQVVRLVFQEWCSITPYTHYDIMYVCMCTPYTHYDIMYVCMCNIGVVFSAWTLFMRIMQGRGSSHN